MSTRLVVTCERHLEDAQNLVAGLDYPCEILTIEMVDHTLASKNIELAITPDALANIIYTSGSTGKPKGVVQNHRNLLHNCRNYTNPMQISARDRTTLLHSCSVMGAVNGIFNALLNGAALYPYDIKTDGLANLPQWLLDEKITIYYSVVTLFRHLIEFVSTTEDFKSCSFPDLRLVRLGGEAVFPQDVALYQQKFSDGCLLYVGLGATETGAIKLFVADKTTSIEGDQLPLGDSVDDMQVRLLNDAAEDVAPGEVGEICVQSPYVALGYWQNEVRSQQAFLLDPTGGNNRIYRTGDLGKFLPDGQLIHRGRKDFQLKIRGNRVETGEIEAVIVSLNQIKAATVIGHRETTGEMQLVAYVLIDAANTSNDSAKAEQQAALRSALAQRLPDYMVPAGFIFLDHFPLTPNGKVNRLALPTPTTADFQASTATYVAPSSPLEKTLCNIWADVLNVNKVGIDDNFFELGGQSLLATQIIASIQQQ